MSVAFLSAELHEPIPLGPNGEPPKEFRIFKKGLNATLEGQYIFDDEAASLVMKAAQAYGNDYSLDYGHGMYLPLSADPAESGKASGWFKPEMRNGELWATNVRWTKKASSYLSEKEYRFFSPAFRHTPKGNITQLLNVALTNTPRLVELQPLMAASQAFATQQPPPPQEPRSMSTTSSMASLAALLSLQADASEQQVMTALASQRQQSTELLALCGASSHSEALGAIRAWKEKAAQTDTLMAKLSEQQAVAKRTEVAALLSAAVQDKKVAPAEVAFLSSMGERDLEQLKGYLAARAVILPPPVGAPAGGNSDVAMLSQVELDVARMLNVSPADFLAEKKLKGDVTTGTRSPA